MEGPAGVKDILDNQNVASFDAEIEVFGDLDFARGGCAGAVACDAHEVHGHLDLKVTDQIRQEDPGALEYGHQVRAASAVIGRDLAPQFPDSFGNFLSVQEDFEVLFGANSLTHARAPLTPGPASVKFTQSRQFESRSRCLSETDHW